MANTFTSTGGVAHSTTVAGLQSATVYSFFVRCRDQAGNANTNDYAITFSIAAPAAVGSAPPAGAELWLRSDADVVTTSAGGVSQWGDQSGNGHHATQTSSSSQPLFVPNAVQGKPALRFDPVDDWLRVPNAGNLNLSSGSYTISFYFKPALLDSITGVLRKGDGPFNLNGRGWEFRTQFGLLEFAKGNGSGTAARLQYFLPVPGRWAHVAVVHDDTTKAATMYVDGLPVSTTAYLGAYSDIFDVEIGRGRDGFMRADLAEVVIYRRALSGAEMDQLQRYYNLRYLGIQ